MYDPKKLEEIQLELEKWEETTLQKTLARAPERQSNFITTSSEPIRRLYTPVDIADLDYGKDLAFPGEYPYTRGVHATLHRGRLWTMRMFAGLAALLVGIGFMLALYGPPIFSLGGWIAGALMIVFGFLGRRLVLREAA